MYPRNVRALQADALFLSALQICLQEPGGGTLGDQVGIIRSRSRQRVRAMDDELIRVAGLATRVACQRMTPRSLKALSDSIEQVCCLPTTFAWDRKATAYAEIVNLLADAAADPVLALLARNLPGHLYDLIVTVGPAADDIIASSHRRLLALIRARDADGAGREMEQHLEGLSWTVRRRGHEPNAPGQSGRSRMTSGCDRC
jgi:DNA-binding FadR family transcriptional regulator